MDFTGLENFFQPRQYDQNGFDYQTSTEENQRRQQLAQSLMGFQAGGQMQNVGGQLVGGMNSPLKTVISAMANVAGAKLMANSYEDKKSIEKVGREVYKQGIELVRNNGFDQEQKLQAVLRSPEQFVGQDLGFLGINENTDANRIKANAQAQLEALRFARTQGLDTLRRANPDGASYAKLFDQQEVKSLFPTEKTAPITLARGAQLVSPTGQVLAANNNTDTVDVKVAGQRSLADGTYEVLLSNGNRFITTSPYRVGDPVLSEGQSVQTGGARDKPIVLGSGQTAITGQALAGSGGTFRADYSLGADEQRFSGTGNRLNSGVVRPISLAKDSVAIDPITGARVAEGVRSDAKTTKENDLVRVAAQSAANGLKEIQDLHKRFVAEGTYDKATGNVANLAARATGGVIGGGTIAAGREIDKIPAIALNIVFNTMKASGLSPGQLGNTANEQKAIVDRIFSLDYANMTGEQLKRAVEDGIASLVRESEQLAQRVKDASSQTGLPITGLNTQTLPPSGIAPSWDRNRR